MPAYLVVLYALSILAIFAPIAVAGLAFRKMLRIGRLSAAEIERISLEKGEFLPEMLLKPWIPGMVRSRHGYELGVRILPGQSPRLALFHHGVSWNWMGAIKYMRPFVREGWTVVAFDSRGHGDSGGGHPSYGFFEKDDLKDVADWVLSRYPSHGGFVVHGESLGAASALQYAPLDPRLDAVIADCPFSNAAAELDHRMSLYIKPGFLRHIVVWLVDLMTMKIDGFSLFDADSAGAILSCDVPLLIIHGREDDFVPWAMSVAMAGKRKKTLPSAMTELLLVPEAGHAASYTIDPKAYETAMLEFVGRALRHKGKT